eukprot:scaffold85645_cov29-Tisochrysis_lutea.AAC.2
MPGWCSNSSCGLKLNSGGGGRATRRGDKALCHSLFDGRTHITQEAGHEVNCISGRPRPEDLDPWMGLDLREFVLCIVLIHRLDLVKGRRSQHLDDLDELVHTGLAREERHAQEELSEHAARRPHIDAASVVGRPEDELGCTVVARADVRNIGLSLDEDLGGAKVAQL